MTLLPGDRGAALASPQQGLCIVGDDNLANAGTQCLCQGLHVDAAADEDHAERGPIEAVLARDVSSNAQWGVRTDDDEVLVPIGIEMTDKRLKAVDHGDLVGEGELEALGITGGIPEDNGHDRSFYLTRLMLLTPGDDSSDVFSPRRAR